MTTKRDILAALDNDIAALGEIAKLYRQEAAELRALEAEEAQVLADLEEGSTESLNRAMATVQKYC